MQSRPALVERVAATLGAFLVLMYAVISAFGGPPSEFSQHPPLLARMMSDQLLVFYACGAVLGLGGLVFTVFHTRYGRWSSSLAGISSSLGNLVSAGIGAGNDARAAFILAVIAIPLVVMLWLPQILVGIRAHHSLFLGSR